MGKDEEQGEKEKQCHDGCGRAALGVRETNAPLYDAEPGRWCRPRRQVGAEKADGYGVKIPCGYCREPFARLRLQRIGNRLCCSRCFQALRNAPVLDTEAERRIPPQDLRGYLRQTALLTFGALAGKAVLFLPLFLWAQNSDVGAAALRGAVGADVFTWIAFSVIAWPFGRFRVGAGAIFELLLVLVYLNRDTLFDITTNIEATAISMVFFGLVMFGKTAIFTVEHVFGLTGITEPA